MENGEIYDPLAFQKQFTSAQNIHKKYKRNEKRLKFKSIILSLGSNLFSSFVRSLAIKIVNALIKSITITIS